MENRKKPSQTLEQQRAWNTWQVSSKYRGKEYVNAAKALPALIMNSGLMQVLAFCKNKGGAQADLAQDMMFWLAQRFPQVFSGRASFADFMQALMLTKPADYQAINAEAFAWLRWLRQFAAAAQKET